MKIKEALALIKKEFESDDGLDVLFRMSSDISVERLDIFIDALKVIENHYQGKEFMEKELVYKLISLQQTLWASSGHWKVSHPAGLTPKKVFQINNAILDIFIDDSIPD